MRIDSVYQVSSSNKTEHLKSMNLDKLEDDVICSCVGNQDFYGDDFMEITDETFKEFSDSMNLKSLGFSEKEMKHIEKMYNEINKLDEVGQTQKGDELWEKMMGMIDQKISEADFKSFSEAVNLKSFTLSKDEMASVKKLFEETNQHALNGNLKKAQTSWNQLMEKLKAKKTDFKGLEMVLPYEDETITLSKDEYERLIQVTKTNLNKK